MTDRDRLAAYAATFAAMAPDRLDDLRDWFTPDARFKDPFNDVVGHEAILAIFRHMYTQVESPRFEVLDSAISDACGYLWWVMHYERGGRAGRIDGLSRVTFAEDGRVSEHIDYWDPAEQLYESLPVLGAVLRAIKRRLAAS